MKKIIFVAAALAIAGCSKHEGPAVEGSHSPVTIDPTITRATEVDFEDGDAIGLTIKNTDGTYAENAKLVYGSGVFSSQEGLLWYDDLGLESTLTAYYPYAESIPATFEVQADQSGDGYGASDFMMASKQNVTPSASAVGMTFKHKMTKIVIRLTNEYDLTVESIVISNSVGKAAVDCEAQTVGAAEGAATISVTAHEVKAGKEYAAIIVPQTAALRVDVTSNGETHTQRLASATLQSGGQYSMNITLLPTNIDVDLSGDIEDWEDKGSLDGSDEVAFEEFDDYFIYDGERYNIVTMKDGNKWMAENLRYIPAGKTVSGNAVEDSGIWYPVANSTPAAGDASLVGVKGLLYDAATAFGVKEITEDNAASFEGTQGICPKGWHIPTNAELTGLVGKNANSAFDNPDAPYYDSAAAGAKIDDLDADGFNWTFAGVRNKATNVANGAYLATTYPTTDPTVFGAMSYVWGSTFYQVNPAKTNIQYFGFMSTYNAANKKITVAYANYMSGYSVRCVKDK